MRAGINGRVKRLEKRIPPTLHEIHNVIDRAVKGTAVWYASKAIERGKGTPEDRAAIDAFWQDDRWQGAKLALDAVWPRQRWETVFYDDLHQKWGYKDRLDGLAFDIWELATDLRGCAIRLTDKQTPKEVRNQLEKELYSRFCQLPEDERNEWRELAQQDLTADYQTGEHCPRVRELARQLAHELDRLEREGKIRQ
jgi:hypothetical protein